MEPEVADAIAKYLNSKVDIVIQSCAGLEPGDFEQVFKEIRKELKKQGKSLTLLIEDITAFTGVSFICWMTQRSVINFIGLIP